MFDVVERDSAGGDVLELDELGVAGKRLVMDFVDDDRPDAWPGIGCAEGEGYLSRVMGIAGAADVTAKGNSIGGSGKSESMAVTGEVAGGIARVQIHLLAVRTEQEAGFDTGRGIEVGFIEGDVSTGRNHAGHRDPEFLRSRPTIGEVPMTDVDRRRVGVMEFDRIHGRQIGMRQDLVDQDDRDAGGRIVASRRSAGSTAGPPIHRVIRSNV